MYLADDELHSVFCYRCHYYHCTGRMHVFRLLQVLKHTDVHGSPSARASTASSAALDTESQLFPFGAEYTRSSTARRKVPPLQKAAQGESAPYDQKVDIWAVGCLLFELLTGTSRQSHHACLT